MKVDIFMNEKYTIGELASLTNSTPKAIRLYEQKGIISPVRNEENGYRYYDEQAVMIMQRVQMLRYLGFSLSTISETLKKYETMNINEIFLEQKRLLEKKAREIEGMIYCMERAANECAQDDFDIKNIFNSLNNIIISRKLDEAVYRLMGNSDEPRGWSRWIYDQVHLKAGEKILDAGCGYGNLWRYNADRYPYDIKVTAVDFHNTYADDFQNDMKDNPTFKFIFGDFTKLDFEGKYDCIFFNHVVMYITDRIETYSMFKNLLSEKGRFIATWNGRKLLDEIVEILCEYDDKNKKKTDQKLQEDLAQKNEMEEQLKSVFSDVILKKYELTIRFDDVQEIYDYIEKYAAMIGVDISEEENSFKDFLCEKYKTTGFFFERDTYLYICTL